MHAKIERRTTGLAIVISGLSDMRGETISIYESLVEHCCRDLSVNELREVARETTAQLLSVLDSDDIPPSYMAINQKVKEVLRKREGKSQKFSLPVNAKLTKCSTDTGIAIDILCLSDKRGDKPPRIYPSLMKHCSKDLSTNELRQIVFDLELQLVSSGQQSPEYTALMNNARESGLIDQLKAVIRNRTGSEPKFSMSMRVKIDRKSVSRPAISITGLRNNRTTGGNAMYIFSSLVEHCSKDFSLDELRQVLWGLEQEFSFRNPDDIPLSYAEMLNKIRAVIRKRRDNDNHQTAASK